MASQMLVSVKGMSACTTPNEASASTTEASCGVSQQTRTCVRTPIGRYLRVGVRHRLNRTADLDGEVDAEPGLKIRALCIIALAELVERGCIEVIVTTFSPRRCDRIACAGIERRSRAVAWPCSQAPTESRGLVSLGTSTPNLITRSFWPGASTVAAVTRPPSANDRDSARTGAGQSTR